MARYESLVALKYHRHTSWTGSIHRPRRSTAPLTEWTARPLGRLGRPLVSEVEAYLQFFSIARDESPGEIARRHRDATRASCSS